MEKINRAVFDTGPFIHLQEIQQLKALILFKTILTTPEILEEWRNPTKIPNLFVQELSAQSKDFAKYLVEKYDLELGEATGVSLCRQEKISLFFTDDLEARETARLLGLEPHGTLAILLRCFRAGVISPSEAREAVEKLYAQSSLFFTKDLKNWAVTEIEKFKG